MSSKLGLADPHRHRVLLCAQVCSPVNARDARGLFPSSFMGSKCSPPPGSQSDFSSGLMPAPLSRGQGNPAPSISVLFTGQELTWLKSLLCAMLFACIIFFCPPNSPTWDTPCLTDEDKGSERGDTQEMNSYWCSGDYKTHDRRCCSSVWSERQKTHI